MPALITHHLFGEESERRLPAGLVSTEEERCAFLIANQGPDPFFFRVRTPGFKASGALGHRMHAGRISRQFHALREGVGRLPERDADLGRAFALGMLSHYVLDRSAHPFVYAQQRGIQSADPDLASVGSQVHAVIEVDLDVLMLQRKRSGATCADCPPADELVTTERINRVAGALMSYVARSVYGLGVGAAEYGGAVADMKLAYRVIEPAGSLRIRALGALEGLVHDYSLLASLAHPVTAEAPTAAANLTHRPWTDPFSGQQSQESFPEIFDRALDDYERASALFVRSEDMVPITERKNYSGRVLDADEECRTDD